jgi:hypothetical protein
MADLENMLFTKTPWMRAASINLAEIRFYPQWAGGARTLPCASLKLAEKHII